MAPLAFQSDPDGTYHSLAVQLRNIDVTITDPDGSSMALFEPIDVTEGSPERSKARPSTTAGTPSVPQSPARLEQMKFQRQQRVITMWVDDSTHDTLPTLPVVTRSNCTLS
jgi:hypothetical protein